MREGVGLARWLSQRQLLPSPAKPATITSAPTRSVAKATFETSSVPKVAFATRAIPCLFPHLED